ncbi:MAG: LysR family transcriptional regulator [Pseudomonadota bacterium]
MLNLRDLEFLTALARRKHFARAAEDCGVSQPAFSMRLRKIEDNLSVALVKRGNRFQGFTAEGEALLRRAYKIMDDLKSIEQDIRSAQGDIAGSLAIGAIPTAVVYAVKAIKALQSRHPNLAVTLHTATALGVQHGVDTGQFDAGFIYSDALSNTLHCIDPLYQERYLLLAHEDLLKATSDTVTWAEAATIPLCLLAPGMQNRQIIDKVFRDQGLSPKVTVESSGFFASVALAREGAHATIVPEHLGGTFARMTSLTARALVAPELDMAVCLMTRARELGAPAVDALRACCGEIQ